MRTFVSLFLCMLMTFSAIAEQSQETQTATTPLFLKSENSAILIDIPTSWSLPNDSVKLPPHVLLLAVGRGEHPFPPSLNVATQPFKGTLKQYLKNVKSINEARGDEWKDLGHIRTESGTASLSQANSKSEWGETRTMHVILLRDDQIYILTASALKEEFPKFYKEFFAAMRSVRIEKNAAELVDSATRKTQLLNSIQNIQREWQSAITQQQTANPEATLADINQQVFNSQEFESKTWTPFKELLSQKFNDMGTGWQHFILEKTENDLFQAPT